MSGRIITALPLTVYDIGSTIPHGKSVTFTAGRVIDVSEYPEAALIIRIHSFFFNAVSPSWRVQAFMSGFTGEDEKTPFLGAAVVDTGALTGTVAPAVFPRPLSVPFGPKVLVQITFSQVNSASSVCSIAMSIDLVAKC